MRSSSIVRSVSICKRRIPISLVNAADSNHDNIIPCQSIAFTIENSQGTQCIASQSYDRYTFPSCIYKGLTYREEKVLL